MKNESETELMCGLEDERYLIPVDRKVEFLEIMEILETSECDSIQFYDALGELDDKFGEFLIEHYADFA